MGTRQMKNRTTKTQTQTWNVRGADLWSVKDTPSMPELRGVKTSLAMAAEVEALEGVAPPN